MSNYTQTPSFYNSEEFFKKYLGRTSYYLGLQKALKQILSSISPQSALELGCATGDTAVYIAQNTTIRIDAVDMREDIIGVATEKAKNQSNITFHCADMTEFIKEQPLHEWDCIYMLYSFHHIPDPLKKKEEFLRNTFERMKKKSYLIILESFLPTGTPIERNQQIINQWFEYRSLEGYASVFWDALNGIEIENIHQAHEIAMCSFNNEKLAGDLVYQRQDEYLVTIEWLRQQAEQIGFTVALCEPVNALGEYAIVLQK